MTRRGRTKGKQLPYDLQKKRSYSKFKEEALDRTVWRTRFGSANGSTLDHECKVALVRVLNKLPDFFSEA